MLILKTTVQNEHQQKIRPQNYYAYTKSGDLIVVSIKNYAPTPTCGYTGSTKNYDRSSTRITIGGVQTYNASYCYDNADKLTSVTGDATMSSTGSTTVASTTTNNELKYDTHGNLTRLGRQTFSYDVSDRYTGSEDVGTPSLGYTYWKMDVADRVTLRSYNDQTFEFYMYSPSGVSVVRDGDWNIIEKRISLPGGLLLTLKVKYNFCKLTRININY
jgi:large repetitive protein